MLGTLAWQHVSFLEGQDESCISGLANNEWLLSLVVNKRRDTQMRLDLFHPAHLYLPMSWETKFPPWTVLPKHALMNSKPKYASLPSDIR
jgi:hypothetical protein